MADDEQALSIDENPSDSERIEEEVKEELESSELPNESNNSNNSNNALSNVDSSEGAGAEVDEEEDEEKKKKESELVKYWKTVADNPMDFTGWTYLLQFVEQWNEPGHCRKAYEAFFSHYPYCYGYWKKYSDMEKKHGNVDKATEVFEKGLRAIPLSVELWLHYINFMTSEFQGQPDYKEKLKGVYKRALAAAGLDFRSDKLWDSYLSWEKSNGNLKAVTVIYEKLISTPTQLYSHHWDSFCQHINRNHPKDILDLDTFLKVRSTILKSGGSLYEDDVGLDEVLSVGESSDVPPGMAGNQVDEKEVKKIRAKYIEIKEVIHKACEVEVSKRWTFEETIRRPYFHVKPLERGQLKNWREYLDFEISEGSHNRIVMLFERSMIACALYEDFWMKYAKYLELHSIDGVRSVYQRACDIHLPKKPYIHLAWAAFEERKDNYPLARKILMNIENNVPGLAMVCMRRISLERRKNNHEAAEDLFKAYIQKAVSHKARTFFSIKYARYMQKIMADIKKARAVLTEALDIDNSNERVFLQLLDVEYQAQPIEEERVHEIFERIFKSEVSLEFKVKVSQRRMEFLEDFGKCIQKISDAYDEHQKLMKEASSKKKRPEREHLVEEPPEKKVKPSADVPVSYSDTNTTDSNMHLHPLTAPPPPPPVQTAYGYNPWAAPSYPSSMGGMYPNYPYSYPPPSYGYYGY